jgi:hypothetical protein
MRDTGDARSLLPKPFWSSPASALAHSPLPLTASAAVSVEAEDPISEDIAESISDGPTPAASGEASPPPEAQQSMEGTQSPFACIRKRERDEVD